jgi:hypothetical protein
MFTFPGALRIASVTIVSSWVNSSDRTVKATSARLRPVSGAGCTLSSTTDKKHETMRTHAMPRRACEHYHVDLTVVAIAPRRGPAAFRFVQEGEDGVSPIPA